MFVVVMKEQDIYNAFDEFLEDGDTWYLISKKWVKKWKSYCGIDDSSEDHPGPIDNSDLLENDLKTLKAHLLDDIDYALAPESAWDELVKMYGVTEGQMPIARKVITVGSISKQSTVEIFPPEISFKLHGTSDIIKETISRVTSIEIVHKKIKERLKIASPQETRLYIEDSVDAIKTDCTLDENSIGSTQVLVLERQNSDGTWPRYSPSPPSYNEATKTPTYKKENRNSANNFNSSYATRSLSDYSTPRRTEPGLCGLSNLGNTCFMNSAIQCLSNAPLLTLYFRQGLYSKEINRTNPIGMQGRLAEAYATLINDMWSGHNSTIAPRDFKYNVSRFAPQFSGYQQHDSQELLAFLIDGLHEDLNRITKKPYVEAKDSGGRPDHVVAEEAWANHLKRNRSIIVDMFHGLFKSTLVCPDCKRVSVTFDPFGFLSLPLPRSRDISVICNFVPKDPTQPITKYNISAPKDGCFADVSKRLAPLVGCSEKCLVITDVYNHRFYKVYKGQERLSTYSDRDNLFVFEIDPKEDGEIQYTKVYMRQSRSGYSSKSLFGHPFLIPVSSGVTTYQRLYNSFLSAITRYIKPEFHDQVGKPPERAPKAKQSDGGSEDEDTPNDVDDTKWFKLVTVNSWGSTVLDELDDDDEPIKFTAETCFSAEWDEEICEKYGVEDWSEAVQMHSSMKDKPGKDRAMNLAQCMSLFTSEEKLGEHDLWYCPGCKDHKQASKKIDLWSLPPFLIIHLKRFSYTRWSREKISRMVDFPTRGWDLSDFTINPEISNWDKQKQMYDLIGVSNHFGGMGGGHYTAYAYNYQTQQWYYFDDSSISKSSESDVKTSAAYMLLYQRRDVTERVKADDLDNYSFMDSLMSPRGSNASFNYDGGTADHASDDEDGSTSMDIS